jgi:hypothetical protein
MSGAWIPELFSASMPMKFWFPLIRPCHFPAVTHAVEDWETGGGRTVWLARTRARPGLVTPSNVSVFPPDNQRVRFLVGFPTHPAWPLYRRLADSS